MTSQPALWIPAYQTHTGLPDPRTNPAGTTARAQHCDTCRALTLVGWDAPLLARLARTDPYALTPRLEAACVILGLGTWRAWGAPGRYELVARHIPGVHPIGITPAGSGVIVVAQHRCGFPPLSTQAIPLVPASHTRPTDPPF